MQQLLTVDRFGRPVLSRVEWPSRAAVRRRASFVSSITQRNGNITVTVAKGGKATWAFSGSKTPLTGIPTNP